MRDLVSNQARKFFINVELFFFQGFLENKVHLPHAHEESGIICYQNSSRTIEKVVGTGRGVLGLGHRAMAPPLGVKTIHHAKSGP